jgi:pyruvate,water dikinase
MKGIPTSKGLYKGRVRVIRGVNDFQRLRDGDVLVIPYSDVGWTPLFTKAGAIIAEAGGFLSHSSIIAREYEIPAVVSVHGACQLKDGTLVTVDGYQGDITIHQNLLETQLTRGNH